MVQLSSLPVAISLPTLADQFGTSISDAALMVVVYLVMLGAFVLLAARLGDRVGHAPVFFFGLVVLTAASGFIALSQDLWQIVAFRAVAGLGSAMIMGNANALLAEAYPPEKRGRAFAVPIIGARLGTLTGLGVFGLMLQYVGWQPIFLTFVPLGLIALVVSLPLLKRARTERTTPVAPAGNGIGIDWLGGALLAGGAIVFILSGSHLHSGDGSFTSSEGLTYHLPMFVLAIGILAVFVVVERIVRNPVVDLGHFKVGAFSLSLSTNVTYHASMLASFTLVPILVEESFGLGPLWVIVVLLPSQALGLFMPLVAGWIYDKYRPGWLRPVMMAAIAGGFLALGLSAPHVAFWAMPLLMLPIAVGTNMFNPVNNATIMNSLPTEHRGVASGMLETSREIGHALGATAAAGVLTLVLPATLSLLSDEEKQSSYMEGFQVAVLVVVFVLLFGAALASIRRRSGLATGPEPDPAAADT
jgi:MFS family permease